MIKPSDIPTEKSIFASAWALMVEGLEAKDDTAWGRVVGHAGELLEQGDDKATRDLAHALARGVMEYLETKEKEKRK